MNLLLDTHVLLWWLDDHPLLSERARNAITDGESLVFLSAVVIWEIRIKEALGKIEVPTNFRDAIADQSFEMLDITVEHAHAVGDLPMHHRDPFDRMLVAQARVEGLTLLTHDIRLKEYKVLLIEA